MGQVNWTDTASRHLEKIYGYLSDQSPTFALNFVENLINSTDILKKFPKSGKKVPELPQYNFREIIRKNYRIVYQIRLNSRDINILALLHCSRDVKKAFLKR